jgi:hypothetical protein
MNLTKPIFSVEYNAVGTDNTGRIAKKASSKIEKIILERANWEETQAELAKSDATGE